MPIGRIALPDGETVPALGQGTWQMGEDAKRRAAEIRALQVGLDLGMTLVDTAEMYASGRAEEITGEAVAGRRDEAFIVSKVLPSHASERGTIAACEQSLRRLRTDRIDLYLLHWRGNYRLQETVAGFEALKAAGKIRHWGVSNFDVADMEELLAAGGGACASNQVLYNLTRRGIEYDLLPWQEQHRISVMAYSPIEQGRLARHAELARIAAAHHAAPAQVALAYVLSKPNVIAIPKAGSEPHMLDNRAAADLALTPADYAALDRAFPPPRRKGALEMI